MMLTDHHEWANEVFGNCGLGDQRRTRRLVDYAARQAAHASASTHAACQGDSAAAEGAYRFLRNDGVDPQAIAESGFAHAAALSGEAEVVLAIQDSTTLGYDHSVRKELGDLGGKAKSRKQGFWVHSTLALDAASGAVFGLVDQEWWVRRGPRKPRGANKKRSYETKESFKWQGATQRLAARLPSMAKVVTVCDREADVHEYLEFMTTHGYRYVVRGGRATGGRVVQAAVDDRGLSQSLEDRLRGGGAAFSKRGQSAAGAGHPGIRGGAPLAIA